MLRGPLNKTHSHIAIVQNQRYHFEIGVPPIFAYVSRDWDVHWGYDVGFDPWPCDLYALSIR